MQKKICKKCKATLNSSNWWSSFRSRKSYTCCKCHVKWVKDWRKRNHKHFTAWQRAYHSIQQATSQKYRKMKCDNSKKWRIEHPEEFKKYHQRWYKENKRIGVDK